MMESARLRADIVAGLGADEDSPKNEKTPQLEVQNLEEEPKRKFAIMQKDSEAGKR